MNNPAKLRFGAWRKPEVEFTLLDWRPREGLASVVDADKRRQVIRFVLPGMLAQGGVGLRVAFPRAAPTRITETCLLPPPCRTTEKEADYLRAAAAEAGSPNSRTESRNSPDLPNWELVWLRHRSEVLLPAPDDAVALAKQLEVFKANQRRAYDACRQELEDWRTKSIGQMIYLGGGRFYPELRNCKPASMAEEVERRISSLENLHMQPLRESMGRLHGGRLNWTPEMARHEALIRDPVLRERWATQHHLKLAELNAEKEAFLRWYRAHCSAPMQRASGGFLDVLAPGARVAAADMALAAEVRFLAHFSDDSCVWLADCPRRDPLLTAEEQRPSETSLPPATLAGQAPDSTAARAEHVSATLAAAETLAKAGQQARADAESGAATLGARTKDLAAERKQFEAVPGKLAVEKQRIEAATDQLTAKSKALDEVISPLNRLYSEVELAEIRKLAVGKGVPEILVEWILIEFQKSSPERLPTKGDVFNHCGPGTGIGNRLAAAGFGISKQRFADHLTVLRKLLVQKGWLAARESGKSRKRNSKFQPDGRLEDYNQPTPAESAEDRDEERQKSLGLDPQGEGADEPDGDSSNQSDPD